MEWRDHFLYNNWGDLDERVKRLADGDNVVCLSVGWLVFENDDRLGLLETEVVDGGCGQIRVIEKALIQSRYEIDFD